MAKLPHSVDKQNIGYHTIRRFLYIILGGDRKISEPPTVVITPPQHYAGTAWKWLFHTNSIG